MAITKDATSRWFSFCTQDISDERKIGNGYIVTLRRGYCWEQSGQHVMGFDTLREAKSEALWRVQPCTCNDCR